MKNHCPSCRVAGGGYKGRCMEITVGSLLGSPHPDLSRGLGKPLTGRLAGEGCFWGTGLPEGLSNDLQSQLPVQKAAT